MIHGSLEELLQSAPAALSAASHEIVVVEGLDELGNLRTE